MKRWSLSSIVVAALLALAPSASQGSCWDTWEYQSCEGRCNDWYDGCVYQADPNDLDWIEYCDTERMYCMDECELICW